MKTVIYTMLALIAFAGNSVLCRLALEEEGMDAVSFTTIRLLSGVVVLGLILLTVKLKKTANSTPTASRGSWAAAAMLFLYAITFSYAYISLETGVGALILFGAVQITMISMSLRAGNTLNRWECLGVLGACAGLVYLVLPTLSTPSFAGFMLMSVSGIAWGVYTLLGRGSQDPLSDTVYNFVRTLPMLVILLVFAFQGVDFTQNALLLAIASGGITSGLGYTLWYAALNGLSATTAAALQLLVPVIAAAGGVVFANEMVSLQLFIASMMILGGVMMVIFGKRFAERV